MTLEHSFGYNTHGNRVCFVVDEGGTVPVDCELVDENPTLYKAANTHVIAGDIHCFYTFMLD